ncbi:MAG: hypothetical protein LM590_05830, partial [Thermofilum sp.]|nr:hypothetical protein [Thermofilum sp.]
MSMLFAYGGAPTFCLRFLDRLSNDCSNPCTSPPATRAGGRGSSSARRRGAGSGDLLHGLHGHGGGDRPREGPDTQHTADAGGAQQDAGG